MPGSNCARIPSKGLLSARKGGAGAPEQALKTRESQMHYAIRRKEA